MSLAWHLNSSKTLVFVPRWHWACYLPRWMGTVHRSLLQDLQGDQRMGRSFDLLSEGRESPGQHPKPWGAQLSGVSAWVQWVFRGGGGAFAFVCMWEAPASAGELQLRCSNCINMKHCSQRRAKSQRSSGVRRVQCSASCFKTEATFGAATCRLNQLSWLVLCFAEGRRTSVIPVRSFLGERIMKYNFHFARVLFMENQRICTAFYAFGELTVWL